MAQNWNPPPGPPGQPPPGGYGAPPPGGAPPGGYGAPPPGGYGAAPPGFGPGAPMGPITPPATEGSIGLGFLAGFFGGCIGLGLVYAIAKGPQTKKGALMGFGAQFVVGVIFRVIAAANH